MSDDLINWLWLEAKKADSREDHDHLLGAAREINRLTRELEASSRPSLIPTAHQLLSDEIDRLRHLLRETHHSLVYHHGCSCSQDSEFPSSCEVLEMLGDDS